MFVLHIEHFKIFYFLSVVIITNSLFLRLINKTKATTTVRRSSTKFNTEHIYENKC